jgi:hypothetical protein
LADTAIIEDHPVSTESLIHWLIHWINQLSLSNDSNMEEVAVNPPNDTPLLPSANTPPTTEEESMLVSEPHSFHSLIHRIRLLCIPEDHNKTADTVTTPQTDAKPMPSITTQQSLQISTERRLPMWDPKYVDEDQTIIDGIHDSLCCPLVCTPSREMGTLCNDERAPRFWLGKEVIFTILESRGDQSDALVMCITLCFGTPILDGPNCPPYHYICSEKWAVWAV